MKKLSTFFFSLTFIVFCLFGNNVFSNVSITAPPLSITTGCYPSAYFTLDDIKISEGATSDFVSTSGTIVLSAPANFEFNPGVGTIAYSGGDLNGATITVTSSTITITYTTDGGSGGAKDALTISGIQILATGTATNSPMLNTSFTGTIAGYSTGMTHATLSAAIGGAVNGTYGSTTLALTSNVGCVATTYTFTQKIPNTAGCNQTLTNTCTVTFPAGTDATTCTGGTYAGVAIGAMTKTATSISFTCTKAVAANKSFTVILDGITNGNNLNTTCTLSCSNYSCGTNSYAAYPITTTACPCIPPTTQATTFSSSAITSTTMTISWARGNGTDVMIIAKAGSAPTDPTDGINYTGNAAFGSGTAVGGGFCVYNGTGTTVNLTGLAPSTTYYFAVYEYTDSGPCYYMDQLNGSATTLAMTCTPPTTQATSFSATAIATTTMTVNWTRGNGNNVMVIALAGSAPTDPINGVSYTGNAAYGSGTAVGGGFCVYNGPLGTVNLTALTQNTTYYFAIYEYLNVGPCYHLTQLIGNATTLAAACTPPTTPGTTFTATSITTNSMTVGWSGGNGNNTLVIACEGTAPSDPLNGITYTANTAYGAGTAVGGGYCVYNGNGSSVNVTSLLSNTTYYFAIYEYNTLGTCYNLTELAGNATTTAGAQTLIIGTGTSTSSAPTPYRGYFWGSKEQYIITAAELAAEGLYAGCTLTALSFNVSTKASTQAYTGFSIKLGHTTTASFSGTTFLTPTFTTVYTGNYTAIAGWNLHSFSSNFTWDGTSNIVVDVCFNNTTYTASDLVYYTTATNSVLYSASDAAGNCAKTTGTVSSSRPNMKFTYVPGPPCSGTPTGGTTTATPTTICFGETSLIQASGSTAGSGITYLWQSSPNNSTWTDITGATSATYSASPTASTYYRRKVTCTNGMSSAYSASSLVTVNTCIIIGTGTSTSTYPYTGNYEDARSQYIITKAELEAQGLYGGCILTSLAFNASSKASTAAYSSFTLKLGHTASTSFASAAWLTPTFTTCYTGNYTTAVGWNVHTFTSNFTWNGTDNIVVQPCFDNADYSGNDPVYYTTTSGNTVCYKYVDGGAGCTEAASSTSTSRPNMKFTFTPGAACSGTPTAGTATATPASICPGLSSTLTLAGNSIGNGITFQWQSGPTSTGPWTNISGATSTSYVVTPAVSTWYRCKDSCSFSQQTAATAGKQVTVLVPTYASIGYTTSFETNWPDKCADNDVPDQYWLSSPNTGNASWRRDDDGATAAWTSPASYIYSPTFSAGARSARFHSGNATSGLVGNLDLYINLSTQTGTKILKFDYINTSGTDDLDVQLSTDGGATFSTLASYALASAWTTHSIDIASNVANCVIRFKATADYGSTDIGIDNLSVVGPCAGIPTAGTATIDNATFCVSGSPVLTLTGYTNAGGITLQWQSSFTNLAGSWVDITGAISDVLAAPQVSQTIYYRCAVRCISEVVYSNVLSYTNTAASITSTNTPVSIACNGTANLTATASSGTVKWYSVPTGGTLLSTGGSYTTPALSANATYYCAANSGNTDETAGMPTCTGTYEYTSINYGIIFNITKQITLNSVTVFPVGSADVVIALQNSSGVELFATGSIATNGNGNQAKVLNLGGWSVPVGTGYRLVLKSYTLGGGDDGTGLVYSSGSYPYTSPSGAVSVTSGWYGTGTTSSNYHFYNLDFSIPCESSPRTPVQVNITSGLTAPNCSANPVPAHNATGVCPVGVVLSWDASAAACKTATSYKLSWGYTAAGTDVMNGIDVGNVTSYNLGDVNGSDDIYWKVVPTNAAGDASGCIVWKFSTAADPGDICTASLGTGVVTVGSLPYTQNNGTTSGAVDDLTSSNLVSCGSTSYFTGEDKVWVFTPAVSGTITITLTSSGTYTGLALYEGCPLSGSTCGASAGYCVGTAQSSTGDKTMTACVTAGLKYYLILDSYASPTFNPYSKLIISAPTGTTTPANDQPCNAVALTLGVTVSGNNSCAGAANEPAKPTCWSSGVVNSVWYKVVATSTQLSVRTVSGTLSDTQIGLFSGTCGPGLVAVAGACNNDQTGCGTNLSSQFTITGLTIGNTYYIEVDGAYDLQGSFSILAIDPTAMTFPLVAGQDCEAPLPTCNTIISIADPGYANVGSNCDFTGEDNCTGGERASLYYTIAIQNGGTLQFDIIPNDYDGTEGSETDYDFLVWKIAGSGTLATCASLLTNSAQGLVACNYSYLGVTGLYPGGGGNPDFEGGTPWDAAYEDVITTQAGDVYLICISNYTQSTSGFMIDYVSSGGTCTINTSAVPTVLYWTGATNTAWTTVGNWGGCSIPSCSTSAVINQTSRDPIISTAVVVVNDLTINSGATLTINAGSKLQVCGNLYNNGTLIANGTIEFISTDAQTYLNTSTTPLNNVIMNQPTPTSLTLFSNLLIGNAGTLTLTSGKIITGTNMVRVNNTATNSVTPGNTTSYVEGNLRRYILSTGSYDFPVGHAAKGYQRANVNFTNATAITYLTAFFTPYSPLPSVSLTECSNTYNLAIDNGYWTINPDANDLSGRYTMTLYNLNYTNSGSTTGYTIMSNHGTGWGLLNGDGSAAACATGTLGAVVKSNMNGFSDFGTAASSGPLPIELLSFTGKHVDGKNVLDWVTATEINNDYFILEKSRDAVVFEKLAEVDGGGNSNHKLYYQQIDHNPYPVTYYKLKQVDFDGAYTYSDIIAIEYTVFKEPVIDIYPNPAIDNLIIDTKNLNCSVLDVEIYDVLGKSVMKTTLTNMMDDPKKFINISSLNYGCYYVRFGCNEFSMVKKFLRGYK